MSQHEIFLYRHGNTFGPGDTVVQVGQKSDLPLTEQGENQAHAFAQFLKKNNVRPAHISSGNLIRQTRSLEIIESYFPEMSSQKGIPALDEIDYGLWEGKTAEQIQQHWPKEDMAWKLEAKWPSQIFKGNVQIVIEQISQLLQQLSTQKGPTVIVSSNGIIRYFLWFSKKWQPMVDSKTVEQHKVKTGHYCRIVLKDNEIEVLDWNIKPS